MKTKLSYSLLAAAMACGIAQGAATAYTTPVGYVSSAMPASRATLLGLTLQQPTLAAGVLDAVSSTTVTDNEVNFLTLLGAPLPPTVPPSTPVYVLELPNGVIQEVTSWTANTLTTTQDLTALVTPGTTTYKLRKSATIASVFGATNSAGLTATPTGNAGTYDEVLVLDAAGTAFLTCFYYNDGTTQTWYDTNFNEVANLPLVYADSFYVRRIAGAPLTLVNSGEVKTTPTTFTILPGNTFAGTVVPAGATLGNSGLQNFLDPDNGVLNDPFDKILLQQPDGSYIAYNYYNDGSFTAWYDANFNDSATVPLTPGMVVQSATAVPKNATLNAAVIGL